MGSYFTQWCSWIFILINFGSCYSKLFWVCGCGLLSSPAIILSHFFCCCCAPFGLWQYSNSPASQTDIYEWNSKLFLIFCLSVAQSCYWISELQCLNDNKAWCLGIMKFMLKIEIFETFRFKNLSNVHKVLGRCQISELIVEILYSLW